MNKLMKFFFVGMMAVAALGLTSCGDDDDDPQPTSKTVTGVVTDENGQPLEGTTVTPDGDAAAAVTVDAATGAYSVTVSINGTLDFARVGYASESIQVNNQDVVNAQMDLTPWPASFAAEGNTVADPAFAANSIQPTASLGTPRSMSNPFFMNVNYKGAVNPSGTPWYAGWSFYDNLVNGNLNSDPITLASNVVEVNEAYFQSAGTTIDWTANNVYRLNGRCYVLDGQTLNIAAGTVIVGAAGELENSAALVVTRGAKINAIGTSSAPIIFTFDGDQGNTSAQTRGQWGGLIILGKASLNSTPGETAIEGLPSTDFRGLYGGSDDADDSGTLRYVSIRHGGVKVAADNEINGLTLGGVGSGTTIEYVEVVGNLDDGIEWFGGTVNGKYIITAFCGDDGFDYDEGYRGLNQFGIVHQDPADADRGGEHDGGTNPENGTPFATPYFVNVTSIGAPDISSRAATLRDNAGGFYYNSIFVNYRRGIDIEDLAGTEEDSYNQFLSGNLEFGDNVFFNIADGTRAADIFKVTIP